MPLYFAFFRKSLIIFFCPVLKMLKNLFYYKSSRKIHYDTQTGTATIFPHKYSLEDTETIKTFNILAVLGILNAGNKALPAEYFFFVTDGDLVGSMNGFSVYSIKKIKYLSLTGPQQNEEADNIKNFIETHHFYCTFSPLNDCYIWNKMLQENFSKKIGEKTGENCDESAVVNRSPFLSAKSKKTLISGFEPGSSYRKTQQPPNSKTRNENSTYLIYNDPPDEHNFLLGNLFCGYYEYQLYRNSGDAYEFEIRSFISTSKIGPRMLCRGVDELGNVSFFVKTVFIANRNKVGKKKDDNEIFFEIFRGSIPLFWSQDDPLKPSKIIFEKDKSKHKYAFNHHFDNFDNEVVVIDLLGHTRSEKLLSKEYEILCKERNLKYINFNLNAFSNDYEKMKTRFYSLFSSVIYDDDEKRCDLESQQNAWESSSDSSFSNSIDSYSVPEQNQIVSCPKINKNIIFRVNCLDCLDRTNLCQFLIFNFFNPYKFNLIKTMWKNNGNALSQLYTGSSALKSDFSRDKKRSFLSRMNDIVISANRMINNTFTDKDKARVIEILLKGEVE
ncbi:hypothetical protein NUSPORA_01641 [Nucleospora cyclopteri]